MLSSLLDPQGSAKAYAAGLVSLAVSEVARFGFHPGKQTIHVVNVAVTGVISYGAAHVVTWFVSNTKKGTA